MSRKALALVSSAISSIKNPRQQFHALKDVVKISSTIPDEGTRKGIMQLALDSRALFPEQEDRQAIDITIGYAMTKIEAKHPEGDVTRLLAQLHHAGIPFHPEFCGTAIEENNHDLAKNLLSSLSSTDDKNVALMSMASEIPYIQDGQRLAELLDHLAKEKTQLNDEQSEKFLDTLAAYVIARPTHDPDQAIEQLQQFGVSMDQSLLFQSLRNIDNPRCLHPESAVRMALGLIDKISSDEHQLHSAHLSLTSCVGKQPFIPEKSVLLHTVLDRIHAESNDDQKKELQTEVAYALARILPDLFALPDARSLVEKCERNLGDMIADHPQFSYLGTVFKGCERLGKPTTNHLGDASAIANAFRTLRGESRVLAIDEIRNRLAAQKQEKDTQAQRVSTRHVRRDAEEKDRQHSEILRTLLDSLSSFDASDKDALEKTVNLVSDELSGLNGPAGFMHVMRDAVTLVNSPEIATEPFFARDALYLLLGEHMEKALQHDPSFETA
jgi:hypothetical protein